MALAGLSAGAQSPKPGGSDTNASTTSDRPVRREDGIRIERDVVYGSAEGVDLKLDLYFLRTNDGKPAPVVVFVHGGAWQGGDKTNVRGEAAGPELVKRGYVVASIDYRLAPKYRFPAQIEDSKCAIRFLRANAAKYSLDSERIGIWGLSAGGHLVALMGLMDDKAGFEGKSGNAEQSSRVEAVVDMYGPTDLEAEFAEAQTESIARNVFGSTNRTEAIFKRASPVTYVRKDAPPFLILQGDKDTLVPATQSQELYDRLRAAGAPATLVVVKNAGHGFMAVGGTPDPDRAGIARIIVEFFDKTLKK
jgi:acetyl esterase/lipase